MTTILQNDIEDEAKSQSASIEIIKRKLLSRRIAVTRKLASRVVPQIDGTVLIQRFSKAQQVEHQILIVTFFTLAITGLLQRYSQTMAVLVIISLFGDVDTLRILHHLAAVAMTVQSIYHVFRWLVMWFVELERGAMMPAKQDFKDLIGMIMFNLDKRPHRPKFDRYSIEEKIEYWALLWGTPLMIITGVMMWFPIQVTLVFPGDAIPIARALHAWEAILATLAILTWHMYHTVIKEKNTSIFTGMMTEEQMRHEHPIEYQRIMVAYRFLQEHTTGKQNKSPASDKRPTVQLTEEKIILKGGIK